MNVVSAILLAEAGIFGHWIWPIIQFAIGLGAVIFIHELGHFLTAKWVGIKVERFAIGFGPRLVGFRKGETDYCLKLLPLGGYVKMLGQEDFAPLQEGEERDPRSFAAKSVGQRMLVISAGVIMNIIFAAILFMIVGMVGIKFTSTRVGQVLPNLPAAQAKISWLGEKPPVPDDADLTTTTATAPTTATTTQSTQPYIWRGLEPGDQIVEIDGKNITRFRQIKLAAALADRGEVFEVKFNRTIDGKEYTGLMHLPVTAVKMGTGGYLLQFGIKEAQDTVLGPPAPGTESPFQAGDRVVAVAGREVKWQWDISRIARELDPTEPVNVTVKRGGQRVTEHVEPMLLGGTLGDMLFRRGDISMLYGKVEQADTDTVVFVGEDGKELSLAAGDVVRQNDELLDILGLNPRMQIHSVVPGSPADDAGLEAGDVIVQYGKARHPSWRELLEQTAAIEDNETKIVVLRDGKQISTDITPSKHEGRYKIGIMPLPEMDELRVARVRSETVADKAGIVEGVRITAVNEEEVTTWPELYVALKERQGEQVTLSYTKGGSDEVRKAEIGMLSDEMLPESQFTVSVFGNIPQGFAVLPTEEIKHGPLGALAWGAMETYDLTAITYATIANYIRGNVDWRQFSGPVGIGSTAIQTGRHSTLQFVYLMALISVSLAVVNFLPIPVVDGGHAVFLIIEKIRGKPVSVKVMNVAQLVGLAAILFAFVMLTWSDIAKLVSTSW
ncbi:MAG: site-2 protease family protein [Phycisphaerae bacterium]